VRDWAEPEKDSGNKKLLVAGLSVDRHDIGPMRRDSAEIRLKSEKPPNVSPLASLRKRSSVCEMWGSFNCKLQSRCVDELNCHFRSAFTPVG